MSPSPFTLLPHSPLSPQAHNILIHFTSQNLNDHVPPWHITHPQNAKYLPPPLQHHPLSTRSIRNPPPTTLLILAHRVQTDLENRPLRNRPRRRAPDLQRWCLHNHVPPCQQSASCDHRTIPPHPPRNCVRRLVGLARPSCQVLVRV